VEETLGVGWVGGMRRGREVAHVTDPFDLVPGDAQDLSGEVENLKMGGVVAETRACVAGAPVAGELANDHRFARGGHRSGLSHGAQSGANGKSCKAAAFRTSQAV
jgi:hypothetical protein